MASLSHLQQSLSLAIKYIWAELFYKYCFENYLEVIK